MSIKIAGPRAKTHSEKLLPSQEWGMHWYDDKKNFVKKLNREMMQLSDFNRFNRDLLLDKPRGVRSELMTTCPAGLSFLQFILRQKKVKNVLEVGTFLGVSAMFFAEEVKKHKGKVVTIEIGEEFAGYARKNFKLNKYNNVEVLVGDAKEILKKMPLQDFQFMFIDGDKRHYLEIFRLLEKRVSKDCVIVFDDAIYHGDIFNNTPKTKHGLGVKKLLAYLKKNNEWTKMLMPIINGMLVLEKKS